jgi:uroporphyrinogen decarboxylase
MGLIILKESCAMNAKENALRIIHFDHPDRVVTGAPRYAIAYQGCHHEGYTGPGDDHPAGSKWRDIWDTEWHKEMEGVMGFPRGYPLAEPALLKGYTWPNPDDERIVGRLYGMARAFPGGDLFLEGSHRDTLWEKAYMLVGMENMMIYLHTEPSFVREVLHRIMNFHLGIAAHYAAVGITWASLGDDLGTQIGPLLAPRTVQEFFVPEYERLFRFYRERGVLIGFHSCGRIDWALETFMRLGVDVLNPIQATANDLALVRATTQGRMALEGGVSTGTVMEGPVERIRAEVRARIRLLGQAGGYFCRPDQGMPFPPEHIAALNAAVDEYGRYPLEAEETG